MADDSSSSVLRRMAGIAPNQGGGSDAPAPGLDRAIAEAVGRVSAAFPGLGVAVRAHDCARKVREVALASMPTPAMILPLATKGKDWTGAVVFDASLSDALVEVQTLGHVEKTARPPRTPTRIDATLARGFASAVLRGTSEKPGMPVFPMPDANRHLADAAELELEVEAISMIVVELRLAFRDSDRTGQIHILLPDRPRASLPVPAENKDKSGKPVKKKTGTGREVLFAAKARLEATLPPIRMSLGELLALREGDVIQLPVDAISGLSLGGIRLGTGRTTRLPEPAITGRLGQNNGMRAIKITDPDSKPAAPVAPAAGQLPVLTDRSGEGGGKPARKRIAAAPKPAVTAVPENLPEPALGSLDDLPAIEGDIGLPGLPDLPDMPADAGMPDLPDVADDLGLPDLPDLPDIDGLADLPDLPDLSL